MTTPNVLDAIRHWLNAAGVPFAEQEHQPTHTSAESAQARGDALAIGAKALVVKADERYCLLVLPANRKLDSPAVKRLLGVKKLRFAERAELEELTGLAPGSVPPFGPPILSLELIADPALLENPQIAFNAGSLTTSMRMASADYQRVAAARWDSISVPP